MQPFSYETMSYQDVPTCLGVLRVRSCGEGQPIVFWASLLMSGRMWSAQAQYFCSHYRVILIDPPGHGDSQALTQGFDFAQCVQCLIQVMDSLGISRAHYVGNSWGGMIGGTFAATYPERIGAAVLMNCTASAAGLRHRLEFPVLSAISKLLGSMQGPLMRPVVRAFTGPTSQQQRPDVITAIREAVGYCRVQSVAWAVSSVVPKRPDQRALMGKICTPVMVVAGEEDQTFSVAETREMAEAIPGSEFVVMAGTAHLAALENPHEVNKLIADFIGRAAIRV